MILFANHNHKITFKDAAGMTRRYRERMRAGDLKGGCFSKDAVLQLLNQPGCAGMRYYYGVNGANRQSLILVGVDAQGNDMTSEHGVCLDASMPCPTHCGGANLLNSGSETTAF